ncbi:cobalt-precorrin-5B (C(1))-methyltransferase CbiD [Pseudodesulfovibrio sediminis]|uniref:Cobalt-precorrin-5B C(1)-methyltransferase n=1 Tax=Pseudodesulfovibrio sediminis TaxID=2810563 RepID=A0ABN6ET09_9BACT|nr:cobalt-precorrin-5B (C(1))-methyltransferase CbiD [Pseudodesulfovibrio sediminis]BCS88562.1 cobalt-precorrin-5B C(1)-methyltransferase [Pseudodesulfovibrio sediminis]
MTKQLRTGRTTGTCAAAAAMAGTTVLLTGTFPTEVKVPLPPGGSLIVPIERIENDGDTVRVTVLKDGGDDPDATHECEIQAVVVLDNQTATPLTISVDGGVGVGRVTLPGLPVPVGEAAINPEPLKQIEQAVRSCAQSMETGHIAVLVEVPEGEHIAQKTMNSRLGIIGGISILGTQGVVKPFSHDSWKATIEKGLDVARAQGLTHIVFTTGRRSERFYQRTHPGLPDFAFIQVADFFEFAMQAAAERGFTHVSWSVFFGKLVKQAQGLRYTHAKTHAVDFGRLADWCAEVGVRACYMEDIRSANTAVQVLGLLTGEPERALLIQLLLKQATKAADQFAGGTCSVAYTVFDFEGHKLAESETD